MTTFISIFILTLAVCGYFAYRLYKEISIIMEAKKIQDEMMRNNFWKNQEPFEE